MMRWLAVLVLAVGGGNPFLGLPAQPAALPTPGFHHLHLNSINPEAAIEFYTKQFPTTSKTTFAGQPALQSPNNVPVLFTKVSAPPATQPPTAFLPLRWDVPPVHNSMPALRPRGGRPGRPRSPHRHPAGRTRGARLPGAARG